MESDHVVCVICNEDTDEKTVRFTETTLNKSKSILKIRKDNNLKFKDISLPEEINENTGYHVKCYKNFLAVMKKYRTSESSTSSNLPASSSEMSSTNVEAVTVAPPIATEESGASTSAEVPVTKTSHADKICVFCRNEKNIVEESDDNENSDSEISDDAEENEC
ncbi:hypothetical protein ACJJTC_000486 [Scirpophaga incertulas]